MGVDRTAKQVQQRAFWTSWSKDVRQFVRACPDCACYLRGKAPRQGYLQSAPVGEPWERISIDICGEFPTSRSGNRYILTVLDLFSRWAESFPIRNHEASTVARVLSEQVFSRFGIPKQILSDRGAEFESALMRELCHALGIDKLRTTSYKPSTNGAVERFHRTLNAMLAKTVEPNQRDWDERVQSVMAAYRASPHSSTGFSPNFLLLGRECRAPLDLIVGPPPGEDHHWESTNDFVLRQQVIKRQAYQVAREQMGVVADRSKDAYDMRVRPTDIGVGSWVYYYCPKRFRGRNIKWEKFYSGPFLVEKVLGPVNFLIRKSPRAKGMVVHVDKLKICHGAHPQSWLTDPVDETETLPKVVSNPPMSSRRDNPRFRTDYLLPRVTGIPLADLPRVERPRRDVQRPARYLNSVYLAPGIDGEENLSDAGSQSSTRTLWFRTPFLVRSVHDAVERPMTFRSRTFRSRVRG